MTLSAAYVLAALAAEDTMSDRLSRFAQPMLTGVTDFAADRTNWNIIAGVGLVVGLLFVGLLARFFWFRARQVSSHALTTTAAGTPTGSAFKPGTELRAALNSCRGALVGIGLFSGVSNALMLTGAIFMLQVYDRVLPSRSVPTLIGLAIIAAVLYAAQGVIDFIRSRLLVRVAAALDEDVGGRIYDATVRLPLRAGDKASGTQPLRDLEGIRAFLSSPGPIALYDLPWAPLYIAIIWAFHPVLGLTALLGAFVLFALTLLTEWRTRDPQKEASKLAGIKNNVAEASRRNAEVMMALGMAGRMNARWQESNRHHLAAQQQVSDVAASMGAVSKPLRFMLQSAILGIGAWLVIHQQATAGIIIAASILAGRALAPVDAAIANWKNFVGARQSWARLTQLLRNVPPEAAPMQLPEPHRSLSVRGLAVTPPGTRKPVIADLSFELHMGQAVGVVGASGSGKSCLTRALVGVWKPLQGRVCLDGGSLDQWAPDALGRHLGYLPQDVELFAGSVAQNIARFESDAPPEVIIAAAQKAGVHDLILSLPEGYETQIGEEGGALSAGQRQRVALARALYRDPFLVVLDEPNSNLDAEGEKALLAAIEGVKARGGIVVVVAHRPDVLAAVDFILPMRAGRSQGLLAQDEMQKQVESLKARRLKRASAEDLKKIENAAAKSASEGEDGEPKNLPQPPRLRIAASQDGEGGAA